VGSLSHYYQDHYVETSTVVMGLQLKDMFVPFDLSNKIMPYMKDEGAILKNLTNALTSIVLCVSFKDAFLKSYQAKDACENSLMLD